MRALESCLSAFRALTSPEGCGREVVSGGHIDDEFLKLAGMLGLNYLLLSTQPLSISGTLMCLHIVSLCIVEAAATHQSRHVRDAAFALAQAVIDSHGEW